MRLLKLLVFTVVAPIALFAASTVIADTVYMPDGVTGAANALISISWTDFFAGALYVPGGTQQVATNRLGQFSVSLEPNPVGKPYAVSVQRGLTINNGFWNVPASGSPLTVQQVYTTVGPTPPVGVLQLGQLAQGGAAACNAVSWGGSSWVAAPSMCASTVILTPADFTAMGYPTQETRTLIPAPGAGKMIKPIGDAVFESMPGTDAYGSIDGISFDVAYLGSITAGSFGVLSANPILTTVIAANLSMDQTFSSVPNQIAEAWFQAPNGAYPMSAWANSPLVIFMPGGNEFGSVGNGSVAVTVTYMILTLQ